MFSRRSVCFLRLPSWEFTTKNVVFVFPYGNFNPLTCSLWRQTHTHTSAFSNTRALVFLFYFIWAVLKLNSRQDPAVCSSLRGEMQEDSRHEVRLSMRLQLFHHAKTLFFLVSTRMIPLVATQEADLLVSPVTSALSLSPSLTRPLMEHLGFNELPHLKRTPVVFFDGLVSVSLWFDLKRTRKEEDFGIWWLNVMIKMRVIYCSMCWEQMLCRGTEHEAYCCTFSVTTRNAAEKAPQESEKYLHV